MDTNILECCQFSETKLKLMHLSIVPLSSPYNDIECLHAHAILTFKSINSQF